MAKNKTSLNKKDLAENIQKLNHSMSGQVAQDIIDAFFEEISTALICGDRVELRGFGSMIVRKRQSNYARNPKTNKRINVSNKGSLYFRASKDLLKQLNAE